MVDSLIDTIGKTHIIKLKNPRIFSKLEFTNPFGMKDRFAKYVIEKALREGNLEKNGVIIESSSGTFALGLALVGSFYGIETHIVTDPRIDKITLAKLKGLGAKVHVVESMNNQGWQGARLQKLYDLLDIFGNKAFWPMQYTNLENRESYASLAEDLIKLNKPINFLVAAIGSGGSLSGTAKCVKEVFPECKVVAVDCVGSILFGQEDNPTRLQGGLGNSLIPANINYEIIDMVHWLNDSEAFSATLDLVKNEQIFAGNSSGSVYWVSRFLANQYKDANIFSIMADRGDRYFDTIYDSQYWLENKIEKIDFEQVVPKKINNINECDNKWNYIFWNGGSR
ncbi:PLP-dependent cysteine synthase family protein [Bacillus cereus]|uniref:PLP-dependent cysteine synthase family protein n=1 Tax=Bacillus cereus TaxID=1396 RepID=UPI000BF97E5C|nr:PLP-dependent cysteine synthase family protein [Bacillus cereus]PFD48732.1 pyridoxal-5'-phosphate-dependent protein [Bacillus cereus]PFH95733.1 pyridoxal-5'-phosphate-dependent protein [Bacillus cereus]